MKQVEQAALRIDEEFKERMAMAESGKPISPSQQYRGMPKLTPIDSYFKDSFKTEIVNKLLNTINERTAADLAEGDPHV
jgi:hypothetical protein